MPVSGVPDPSSRAASSGVDFGTQGVTDANTAKLPRDLQTLRQNPPKDTLSSSQAGEDSPSCFMEFLECICKCFACICCWCCMLGKQETVTTGPTEPTPANANKAQSKADKPQRPTLVIPPVAWLNIKKPNDLPLEQLALQIRQWLPRKIHQIEPVFAGQKGGAATKMMDASNEQIAADLEAINVDDYSERLVGIVRSFPDDRSQLCAYDSILVYLCTLMTKCAKSCDNDSEKMVESVVSKYQELLAGFDQAFFRTVHPKRLAKLIGLRGTIFSTYHTHRVSDLLDQSAEWRANQQFYPDTFTLMQCSGRLVHTSYKECSQKDPLKTLFNDWEWPGTGQSTVAQPALPQPVATQAAAN